MENTKIQIIRKEEIKSYQGPNDYFSGKVTVDGMLPAKHESGVSLALVTFEPSARTAWHTHPKGQILLVTEGSGLVQEEGKNTIEIKKGDIVWFPAGIKHWHGACKDTAMSHISIVVEDNGNAAKWLEKVSDTDYLK